MQDYRINSLSLHAFSWFSSGVLSDSLPYTVGRLEHSYEFADGRTDMPSWAVAVVVGSVSPLGDPAC